MNRVTDKGAASAYPNRRADTTVKLAPGDWMKLALYTLGLLGAGSAGWYGLKSDVHSLYQEQNYAKERDKEQDVRRDQDRREMLDELKAINNKLDSPRFRR